MRYDRTSPLVRFPIHHAVVSGPGIIKAIWVDPVPHLITRTILVLGHTANVTCTRVPDYWIDRNTTLPTGAPPQPGDEVLYRLSAHPANSTADVLRGIYQLLSAVPYNDANAFTAALLDALAG